MSERPSRTGSTGTPRLQALVAELNRMVTLRRELAALELAHDRRLLLRGAWVGGAGAVAIIIGTTLLLHAAADGLAALTQPRLDSTGWTLILAAALLVPGSLFTVRVYRQIRSGFCGLRGTLAELNEDLIWLREWTEPLDGDAASSGGENTGH